jgi:hypothetical protein
MNVFVGTTRLSLQRKIALLYQIDACIAQDSMYLYCKGLGILTGSFLVTTTYCYILDSSQTNPNTTLSIEDSNSLTNVSYHHGL